MADDAGEAGGPRGPVGAGLGGRGSFPKGFRSSLSSCGRGSVQGRGCGALGGKNEDKECIPFTTPGCLVKDMKINSLEEIYLFSLPIKEFEIIDSFSGSIPKR